MYSSQARILGFAEELVARDGIRVGTEDFNSQVIDPPRAKCASGARLSIITTCKGSVVEIVQSTDSPRAAWRELLYVAVSSLWSREKSRLMREFNLLKMGLGEDHKKFTIRMDRVARELQRVGKSVNEDDNNLAIPNAFTQEYVVGRRMLEGENDEPTRADIDKIILNQYKRLRAEKCEAGAKALPVAATPGHHKPQPAPSKSKWRKQRSKFDGECFKCGRRGHRGQEYRRGKQKKKYEGCFICGRQAYKAANESTLLTRVTTVAINSGNNSLGSCETWTSNSGATSTMALSSENFLDYIVEPEGRYVEIANGKLLPVVGCGQLEIVAE